MQFYYQLALLLVTVSQTLAAPSAELQDKDLTKRACAPAGQESCCVTGFYRIGTKKTNIQTLVSFGTNGGLTNIGITTGCSVNIDRVCGTAGGCGSWAVAGRNGCNGVEINVSFLDRCGSV